MSKQSVWKAPFRLHDVIEIRLPVGAKVLHVDIQRGEPYVWFLCDPDAPMETRKFLLTGTGHLRDDLDAARYVGTFQMRVGVLVFHLFEAQL